MYSYHLNQERLTGSSLSGRVLSPHETQMQNWFDKIKNQQASQEILLNNHFNEILIRFTVKEKKRLKSLFKHQFINLFRSWERLRSLTFGIQYNRKATTKQCEIFKLT